MFSSVSTGESSRGSSMVSQWIRCSGSARADEQAYAQDHPVALRRRDGLPVRVADRAAEHRLAQRPAVGGDVRDELVQLVRIDVDGERTLDVDVGIGLLLAVPDLDPPGHTVATVQADLEVGVVGHGGPPGSGRGSGVLVGRRC